MSYLLAVMWTRLSEYEQDACIELLTGVSKGEHYERNEEQDANAPGTLEELRRVYDSDEEFEAHWMREGESPTHNLNSAVKMFSEKSGLNERW